MISLKTVLVPTDFSPPSEQALRYAKALADAFGASLHVIHDDDGPQAASTRRRLLARLAATGGALYAAHLPQGGPYAVRVTAQGFALTPAA